MTPRGKAFCRHLFHRMNPFALLPLGALVYPKVDLLTTIVSGRNIRNSVLCSFSLILCVLKSTCVLISGTASGITIIGILIGLRRCSLEYLHIGLPHVLIFLNRL